jgi:hypothetical protein
MGAQEAIICATFAACNSSVVTGELWTTKSEGSAATVPESGVAPLDEQDATVRKGSGMYLEAPSPIRGAGSIGRSAGA